MPRLTKRVIAIAGGVVTLALNVCPSQPVDAAEQAIVIVDEKPALRVTPFWPADPDQGTECERPDSTWRPFRSRRFDHRVSVLLRNDSAEKRTLSLELVTRDGASKPLTICSRKSTLDAGESTVVFARAAELDDAALGSAIVVTATSGDSVLSATAPVDVTILPHSAKYWTALLAAVFAGVAVAAAGLWECRKGLNKSIQSEKGWKLGDSWATTITAAGALLTTTLGASGLLEELAPTVNGPRVVALGLAFGALAVLAPIATSAFAKFTVEAVDEKKPNVKTAQTNPTGWSLVAGGALTVIGIYGQLTLFALLVSEFETDDGTRWVAAALIFAAMSLVAVYALRTWHALTVLDRSDDQVSGARSVSPGL